MAPGSAGGRTTSAPGSAGGGSGRQRLGLFVEVALRRLTLEIFLSFPFFLSHNAHWALFLKLTGIVRKFAWELGEDTLMGCQELCIFKSQLKLMEAYFESQISFQAFHIMARHSQQQRRFRRGRVLCSLSFHLRRLTRMLACMRRSVLNEAETPLALE